MTGRGVLCLRFDIDTFSSRHAFTADVGWGEFAYLPRILSFAADRKVQFQFCTCGQGLREYPREHEAIRRAGCPIDSHLYTHTVTLLDPPDLVEAELILTEKAFADHQITWTGIGATGMYPNGIDEHPETQKLLTKRGYQWCSTRYKKDLDIRQMQPYWLNEALLEIPGAGMSDRNYFYDKTAPVEGYARHVITLLEQAHAEDLFYSIDLHPGVLARFDPECRFLTSVLDRAEELGVPLMTMDQIRQICATRGIKEKKTQS